MDKRFFVKKKFQHKNFAINENFIEIIEFKIPKNFSYK